MTPANEGPFEPCLIPIAEPRFEHDGPPVGPQSWLVMRSAYLAGPMRGLPEYNFPAFHAAAADLRARGLEVFSPAERDIEEDGFDPKTHPAQSMAYYMQHDLPAVCRADCVVVLPGWEDSQGASLEVYVAAALGKPVFLYPELRRVGERHPNSARFHQLLAEAGQMHDRKQKDYGSDTDPFANVRASENWGIPGWVGALVRLSDKVARLQSFARRGSLANESAKDSMMDIAVYALIAYTLYEQVEQNE